MKYEMKQCKQCKEWFETQKELDQHNKTNGDFRA